MASNPKKIVIASDSFKGSLSSHQVAQCVERALCDVYQSCEIVKVNVADGGEGTLESLSHVLGGRRIDLIVCDPLGRPCQASYVILEDNVTAVLEMSSASGLTLLAPEERNPSKTSTIGTGELILDALNRGCRRFLVGLGGSATNDAGMGMLHAVGYRFLDASGRLLYPKGESLAMVSSIDAGARHPALEEAEFIVACDVKAPLYGTKGSAYVYAPQKGADAVMVEALDFGLRNFAEVSKEKMGHDCSLQDGTGAAGGLGYAFKQFLGARLEKGVDVVLDAIHFDEIIDEADLVITGEGRIDSQTLAGKTPFGVAQRSIRKGIPVIAICGLKCLDQSQILSIGFKDVVQVTPDDMPLEEAMMPDMAAKNIYKTIIGLMSK